MRKNTSPRIKAKTSRRMMARRRISRRKIGITRARERVLPLNQAKNSPSLMLTASFTMALIVQKTVQSEKLNAMVAENGGVQSDEEVPSRMNPLQLLNALCAGDTSRVSLMFKWRWTRMELRVSRFWNLNRSLNHKRERFKVFKVEPRLNRGRTVMTS